MQHALAAAAQDLVLAMPCPTLPCPARVTQHSQRKQRKVPDAASIGLDTAAAAMTRRNGC